MDLAIKKVILPGQLWNSALDELAHKLYSDCRNEKGEVELVQLDLTSFRLEAMKVEHTKWTQLVGASDGQLFFVEYLDPQDPNRQIYFNLDWETGNKKEIEVLTGIQNTVVHPSIYEHGSSYHKTVADFLSLDLPLACEYLEWNDKIIISYYLRSGNEYERNLLLISNGSKEWKIVQDNQVKGFSAGSFFVYDDRLIFVKNRNEVCICTL